MLSRFPLRKKEEVVLTQWSWYEGAEAMAYLRKEKETVEIDHAFDEVWAAIPKALESLEWEVQETDDLRHHIKAKTKAGFMLFSSILSIDVIPADVDTTRVIVIVETPVTTITAMVEFGRARERVDLLFETLAKQLNT
jgi:hypothetical protein